MVRYIVFVIVLISWQSGLSQDDCPCCTEFHKQFDFWEGDWEVFDTLGNKVGENQIYKLEDGCILNENWKGTKGSSGKSYNYFNPADSTWNQLWIDSSGGILELKGTLKGNKMVLRSELQEGRRIKFYYNQISWTNNADNSVTQVWDLLDKDGNIIRNLFHGIYRRQNQD